VRLLQAERPFVPYGPEHWVILLLLVVGAVILAVVGRRYRDTAPTVARVFAVVIVAFQVPVQIYFVLPSQWDVNHSLPFQLCDLAWLTAAYTLWTRSEWAYALTYYWGLTLTPQAMITPSLDSPNFPDIHFIQFWLQHLLVVWAAVYLTWVVGMRPTWRSLRIAVWATLAWGVAVFAFNDVTGANYGFVNGKPPNPSLLDLMGSWPWYLAVEFAVGLAGWVLVTWPWTRLRERTPPAGVPLAR
jgi:hypothetical integral membrane protein (TIGR02206 family)